MALQIESPAPLGGAETGLNKCSWLGCENGSESSRTVLNPQENNFHDPRAVIEAKRALVRELLNESLSFAIPAAANAMRLVAAADDDMTLSYLRDFYRSATVAFQAAASLRALQDRGAS